MAAPHDGYFAGLGNLVDHPHGHGEDRGTRKTAHRIGDDRLAVPDVDPHPQQGIYQADAVGARFLARPGDRNDVRDVGRQLDVNGFGRHGLHGARYLGGTPRATCRTTCRRAARWGTRH